MIENIDRLCGELIDIVEGRGELDNTLIIYSADHGEMLGDFDRFGKTTWRYGSAHVPLIIAGPGIQQGVESAALVDLTDVAATILESAGCPDLPEMNGRSLRNLLEGHVDKHRDLVHSAYRNWKMVYDGRYKVVSGEQGDNREGLLLFDLSNDPHEEHDIAAEHPEVVERLAET